jgi:hypothetical protein
MNMSTHCRVGIVVFPKTLGQGEGVKVRSVYVHHDGYLSGVGKTLKDHYQDVEKVNALLDAGDMSAINPEGAYGAYKNRGEEGVDASLDDFPMFGYSENFDGVSHYYLFIPGAGWLTKKGTIASGAAKWEGF